MREERFSVLNEIRTFRIEHEPVECSNWLYVVYDSSYTNFLQTNMIKVKELLERFECFRDLFPNWKAMRTSVDKLDATLVLRISLLYMWYNNLDNLFKKIKDVINMAINEIQFLLKLKIPILILKIRKRQSML